MKIERKIKLNEMLNREATERKTKLAKMTLDDGAGHARLLLKE